MYLRDKTVLITGAAGSVGEILTLELLELPIRKLILVDNSERLLFALLEKLKKVRTNVLIESQILDIRFIDGLSIYLNQEVPDVFIHAAAFKHVPLMEKFPLQAVQTNLLATSNLADWCIANGVNRFVFISTDKAVNPSSIMGASKRAAELLLIEAIASQSNCQFYILRFGNVIRSSGSVHQIFENRLSNNEVLEISHKDAQRYFISKKDMAEFVFQILENAKSPGIYVPEMGSQKSIRILAQELADTKGRALKWKITGLRPGEKVTEEILGVDESLEKTWNPLIQKVVSSPLRPDFKEFKKQLHDALNKFDKKKTVLILKEMIPEYVSQNSPYSKLDGKCK